jgi:hypothetical protein
MTVSIIQPHGAAPVHALSRASVGVVVACPCGEVYELRPEYAGRLLECPTCRRHLRAGPPPNTPRPSTPGVDHAFDRDVFLLRQRVFTITSKYEVWAEDGTPILYVERPTYPVRTLAAYLLAVIATLTVMGWAADARRDGSGLIVLLSVPFAAIIFLVISMSVRPRRHVAIYRDESRRETSARDQDQRRVPDPDVHGSDGDRRDAGGPAQDLSPQHRAQALVRHGGRGELLAMAIEDSIVLSLLRRVLGTSSDSLRTNFVSVRGRDAGSSASSTGSSPCWIATCSISRLIPDAPSTGGSPSRSASCSIPVSAADVSAFPETPLRITPDMLLSRRVDLERRMGRVPPVTLVVLALLTAIFVAEVRMEALGSRESIIAMGALARERVVAGEYWRLLTAPWLHGGVEHLVGNGSRSHILGMVCEAAFGRAQLVVLYVLSGLGLDREHADGRGAVGRSLGAIFGRRARRSCSCAGSAIVCWSATVGSASCC